MISQRCYRGSIAALFMMSLLIGACGDDDDSQDLCRGKSGTAGTRSVTIESGGLQRSFMLSVPDQALGGGPVPLVLLYQGVFADGAGIWDFFVSSTR